MVNLAQVGACDFCLQGGTQVVADDGKEDAITVLRWKCLTTCCSEKLRILVPYISLLSHKYLWLMKELNCSCVMNNT